MSTIAVGTAPRWGNVADAASESGKSENTVRRWISEGRVRAERVGAKAFRVDLDSLSHEAVPGLPTPAQLTATLQAVTPADMQQLATIAAKISAEVGGSVLTFTHVWLMVGAAARTGSGDH